MEQIAGKVAGIVEKTTSTGKPKKVLELDTGGQYPTRLNFSGFDLDALSGVAVGQQVTVDYENFEIPSGPHAGTKMRMGRKVSQGAAPAPRQSAPAQSNGHGGVNWDAKSTKIGLYACLKVAGGVGYSSLTETFGAAVELFKMVEQFAETYKPETALDRLRDKIAKAGDGGIVEFILKSYKVASLDALTGTQLAHALERWPGIVRAYNDACTAQEESQRDHRDEPDWEELSEAAPAASPAEELPF